MEESIKPVDSQTPTAENLPAVIAPIQAPAAFTKVDNNLTGIGFFTASSKRSRKAIEKTTIVIDQGVERRVSILPSAKYGLPITQDQDYWLALMQLVDERRRQDGKLENPFRFSTAELTKILGQAHSGKNYKAVQEWLSVMKHTGIEGGAYNAAKKKWFTDRVSAVDRALSTGEELPDGTLADKNHIWFSQWQLDNINSGNLIAIELNTYTQLVNNISKNLVPHLQEWLYASQRDGRFEKQYEDICQLLGIRTYRYRSQIEEQFSPSLIELTSHGYLSKWGIEPMAHGKNFKLVLWHGPKYHSDRQARIDRQSRRILSAAQEETPRRPRQRRLNLTPGPESEPQQQKPTVIIDFTLVAEFEKRGVGNADARNLITSLPPGQAILDQLEYGDYQIARQHGRIDNPPGFYISLLQRNVPVPTDFLSSRKAKAVQEANLRKRQAIQEHKEAALAAEAAEEARLNAEFERLSETDRLALLAQVKAEQLKQFPKMAHWLATDSEANSFLLARARKKLRDGWTPTPQRKLQPENPHYAINSPSRQATPLQEIAPQAPGETPLLANLKAILETPQLPPPAEPEQPRQTAMESHLL